MVCLQTCAIESKVYISHDFFTINCSLDDLDRIMYVWKRNDNKRYAETASKPDFSMS